LVLVELEYHLELLLQEVVPFLAQSLQLVVLVVFLLVLVVRLEHQDIQVRLLVEVEVLEVQVPLSMEAMV
jgi:hypothetical protein